MSFWDTYMSLGGSGCTLGLIIAIFLFSKRAQLCHQHEDQQTGQTLHDAFQRLLQEGVNQLVKGLIAQLDQRKVDSSTASL